MAARGFKAEAVKPVIAKASRAVGKRKQSSIAKHSDAASCHPQIMGRDRDVGCIDARFAFGQLFNCVALDSIVSSRPSCSNVVEIKLNPEFDMRPGACRAALGAATACFIKYSSSDSSSAC